MDPQAQPAFTGGPETTRVPGPRGSAGMVLGPYRLLDLLGEGGMGEVWLAEQSHPIRRQVAVKLIKPGMDSRQVIARFEAERQALALMDHPAIATVFDGGSTADGRPYFAMEFVKGEPLNRYCDRLRLSTDDRLTLFMQVCDGVQHAHQKGVIHRDLKPSNVLVTVREEAPAAKIIDFGVAKAVAQPLTDGTLYTAVGALIGTPEYMSPEQAESAGTDIDTRTDIYALGVMLYELLCGTLPFDPRELHGKGITEMTRMLREQEPQRPSTRVTQLGGASTRVASCRRTEPHKLVHRLRGDLDWITMKALEKDRTRRYATASALASDIRHHLAHEPVSASPPSTLYRTRKFVRRHRYGVAVGATIAAALVAVTMTTAVQAGRLARERDRANQEAARANQEAAASAQVIRFLLDLFKVSDPSESRGNAITAREILDRGSARIDSELAAQPEVQGRLMSTMGTVYQSLGLYKDSAALLHRSLDVRRRAFGNAHPAVAESLHQLGMLQISSGEFEAAERTLTEARGLRESLLGAASPELAETIGAQAILAHERGDFANAERLFRQRLAILRGHRSGQDAAIADTLNDLAITIEALHADYDQAKVLLRQSLAMRRALYGSSHPLIAQSLNNLAMAHYRDGELDAAEPLFREALAQNRRLFGDKHPEVSAALNNLGLVLRDRHSYGEADEAYAEAVAINREVLGTSHNDLATNLVNWAETVRASGDFRRAEQIFREALAVSARALGAGHWQEASARSMLALCLIEQQRFSEAEELVLWSYRALQGRFPDTHPRVQRVMERVVAVYERWGKPAQAAEWRARIAAPSS